MGKLLNIAMLCALIIAVFGACANGASKTLSFHLYAQEYLSGPNRTLYDLTSIDGVTSTSPTLFGLVRMMDNLITATPDPNSRKIGRLQGLVTFCDLHIVAPKMDLQIVFTSGSYKGSVLIMQGKYVSTQDVSELVIVGGSGRLSTARGKVNSSTYLDDEVNAYRILEYVLTVTVDDIGVSSKVSGV